MDADKYNRTISLLCPTCGCTQFAQEDAGPEGVVTCSSCGRELRREELIRENGENIAEHVSEIKKEVVKDMEKELKNMLSKAFKGNKNFRIR